MPEVKKEQNMREEEAKNSQPIIYDTLRELYFRLYERSKKTNKPMELAALTEQMLAILKYLKRH